MAPTIELEWIREEIRVRRGEQAEKPESTDRGDTESVAIDVRVSAFPLGEHHPLAHLFGSFNDEPLWEEFEAEIRANPNVIDYDIE